MRTHLDCKVGRNARVQAKAEIFGEDFPKRERQSQSLALVLELAEKLAWAAAVTLSA